MKTLLATTPTGPARRICWPAALLICSLVVVWLLVAFARHSQGLLVGLSAVTAAAIAQVLQSHRPRHDAQTSRALALLRCVNVAVDLFWETDVHGRVTALGGRQVSDVLPDVEAARGSHYLDHIWLETEEHQRMDDALAGRRAYSDIQATMRDPAGQRYHVSLSAAPKFDENGKVCGYVGIGTNVTQRVRDQARLRYVAEHDILTGLANRFSYTRRIAADLRRRRKDECLAILAIDLDGFKTVNDKYGHLAGDALLKLVAKRLMTHIRDGDWAARLGGDEFVVVSPQLANPMAACLIAARLVAVFERPYKIGGIEVSARASIGIACTQQDGLSPDQLLKCADRALYQAKTDGRGCYRLFQAKDEAPALQA